jgi:hypothetical protein
MNVAFVLVLAAAQGLEIERSVVRVSLDPLGRREELRRRERLLVRPDALAVVDLTFGERWILRASDRRILHADPLLGEASDLPVDRLLEIRRKALDEIRGARARVKGTQDEKDLDAILEGFDSFDAEPRFELRTSGERRDLVLNGDRSRASLVLDAGPPAPGWFAALESAGAFPPAAAGAFKSLPGLPVKGTLRYVFMMERVIETFEVLKRTERAIPDSEFELPAGLKLVPMPGVERPAERRPTPPSSVPRDFKEDDPKKGSP